jgi:hypothetical protein
MMSIRNILVFRMHDVASFSVLGDFANQCTDPTTRSTCFAKSEMTQDVSQLEVKVMLTVIRASKGLPLSFLALVTLRNPNFFHEALGGLFILWVLASIVYAILLFYIPFILYGSWKTRNGPLISLR